MTCRSDLPPRPLAKPKPGPVAMQVRDWGLSVGDRILGIDERGCLAILELLWLGRALAVWRCTELYGGCEMWTGPMESAAWGLDTRRWFLIERAPTASEDATPKPAPMPMPSDPEAPGDGLFTFQEWVAFCVENIHCNPSAMYAMISPEFPEWLKEYRERAAK